MSLLELLSYGVAFQDEKSRFPILKEIADYAATYGVTIDLKHVRKVSYSFTDKGGVEMVSSIEHEDGTEISSAIKISRDDVEKIRRIGRERRSK